METVEEKEADYFTGLALKDSFHFFIPSTHSTIQKRQKSLNPPLLKPRHTARVSVGDVPVGDHDHRAAFLLEIGHVRDHLFGVLGVQVSSRFVGQKEFRFPEQSARKGGALFFPRGKFAGPVMNPVG
jgi:hypothetical protein